MAFGLLEESGVLGSLSQSRTRVQIPYRPPNTCARMPAVDGSPDTGEVASSTLAGRTKLDASMGEYRLPITAWSATDYAYLVNNQLGWVSDDDRFWVFDSEDKMQEFRKYLGL